MLILCLRTSFLVLLATSPLVAQRGARVQTPAATPKADEKTWDVTRPFGPTTPLVFDTSEGTWMNVDVSPDGARIIFDLLGDLYTMPIAGSGAAPATRLTSGPAFDMQPRFSPDGKSIAFTSDRGGLFNIWVMDVDGGHAKAVSKEQKWWVNSPAWSPDSQYLFARRHFVQTRSLGAGEVWMFHRSGAEGLQVTEKASWQKDAGEPAVSPDGRYLYYSKDVTPGANFDYNRNPYDIIYAIIRRDLQTGRERTYTNRPGGSLAPRPSPDGRRLAFIRRVDTKTALFVKDVATGAEVVVWDGLDHDLQEAWSMFGTYTQYAWLPDSSAMVIWAKGKLWKVTPHPNPLPASGERGPDDAASSSPSPRLRGEGRGDGAAIVSEIPFTAHVDQTITNAVRFTTEVAPDRFPVRMLRDATVSPDGKAVAYSALGHVYVKTLPGGEPRRVTADAALEFDPAFSPDGRTLVYTTWTDAAKGRVRTAGVDGGGSREIVATPGHYTEPSFSPDGSQIVYRAASGDNIRGTTFAEETGIFVVAAAGGSAPRLVREEGVDPEFDHTGTRIYFRDRRDNKAVLVSVTLGNADEIVHARSDNATQIVPSPDGRWLAFTERWRAWVAPFPRTGRPIDLAPKGGAFPVAQISRDSGWALHWSDATHVHWTLGPELFTRDLTHTFPFVAQGLEKPDEPESKGTPIGFSATSDKPTGRVAFVGARLVTMAGGGAGAEAGAATGVIENGVIVVDGNRIVSVGAAASMTIPVDAKRVDVAGKTIIPGLIDVHAHLGGESSGILAETSWPLAANLAYGVTTSHDPSNDTETVFTNSEMIRAGLKLGPRLYSTGTILYGAETPFKAVVDSYDDALMHMRRLKAAGAFSVKSYNQERRDTRQMFLKAARELQMLVVPEGGSLLYHDETMIQDGHTGIEHNLPPAPIYKDVITLFAKSRVGYTPTLIVSFGGLAGEYYWYQHDEVWKNERLLAFTPRDVVVARARRRATAGEDDFHHIAVSRAAKSIAAAGGSVQLGAHGQLQGLGAHWELWMLAQGGMTPLEALRCATINGARYLGLDKDLGSIEPGKLADLVVLDRNPLDDIRHSDSVRMVMLNGRLLDASTLDETVTRDRRRPPFPWQ
jgi:Tol biopolymer transport system component/imidazolonepropionase-like amidohydrolase